MRKRKIVVLLVLAIIAAAVLKCCGGKEEAAEQADPGQSEPEATVQVTENETVPLGTVEENEDGGIRITITKEDGTTKEYVFTDVAPDSWYVDAVNFVVSTELMNGGENAPTFQPNYGIQRLQFAAVLYRFAGGVEEDFRYRFNDMQTPDWYDKYIAWATNRDYMKGKNDGSFDPFGYLSCEDALIVLYRLAGEPKPGGTLEDYPYAPKVSEAGRDAVAWAWNSGLIVEQECVWYPTQTISRAQVALLFMRYNKIVGKPA